MGFLILSAVSIPQLVPSAIPIIGHVIGMMREGSSYYGKIARRYNLPIYALGLPRGKVYVVTSPDLIALVDRRAKYISFAPYAIQFAKRILIPSRPGLTNLETEMFSSEHDRNPGLLPETLKAMHDAMSPGEHLLADTRRMVSTVTDLLPRALERGGTSQDGVGLFGSFRHIVTEASTSAIYGAEMNPFNDPAVYKGFWAIDDDFALLGLNFFRQFLAPRGNRGRNLFFQAMKRYYASGAHESASHLIQARYEVNRKHGVSLEDIEHFDLSITYALLVHTVPGTCWAIYYVYRDASLLNDVRSAIEKLVGLQPKPYPGEHEHVQTVTVNIRKIFDEYPFLKSLVLEVLRLQSTNATGRVVIEDTMIDDKYLLKKDSIIFIPSGEVHHDQGVWGPKASVFEPDRFLPDKRVSPKVHASAYRTFGSGVNICPGRHFALNEIVTFLAIMVLQYDVVPVAGEWKMPKTKSHITTSILTPIDDVKVRLVKRAERAGLTYVYTWE
ncbi:cytochrome P450 [Xylariaceae sp. FL0255]|nr:cytochrome P450 [Xylariaceae sp. FL0255]